MIRFHPEAEKVFLGLDVITQTRLFRRLAEIEAHPHLLGSLGLVGFPSHWARVEGCLLRLRLVESSVLPEPPFLLVTALKLDPSSA